MASPADLRVHRITSLVEDTLLERGASDQLLNWWHSKESLAFTTPNNTLPAAASNARDRWAALEVIHSAVTLNRAPLENFFDAIVLYDMDCCRPPITTLHQALTRALACYTYVTKRDWCHTNDTAPMALAAILKYVNLHSERHWSVTVERNDVLIEERALIQDLPSTPPSMLGWLASFSARLDAITYGRLQDMLEKIDKLGAWWAWCLAWGRPSGQGGLRPRNAAVGVFALAVAAFNPVLVEQLVSPEDRESRMATIVSALAELRSLAPRNANPGGSTSQDTPSPVPSPLDRALAAIIQVATLAEETCVQESVAKVLELLQAQPMLATQHRPDARAPPVEL